MLLLTLTNLHTPLTAVLDTTTGAVVVTDSEGVVALGLFDMQNWWLNDELGPLSDDGFDDSIFGQLQDGFHALLEDMETAEDGDHYDDGADDAYALASAYGYDAEAC